MAMNILEKESEIENINVAYTRIKGKYNWFICDSYGRSIVGSGEASFDTMLECMIHFIKNGKEANDKLVLLEK